MAHKILLSHSHLDKAIVEPVAIRLRQIFGEDKVFYDSWSIRPGDNIIEKINQGLGDSEIIFFFVTANSIKSEFVSLEWRNALYSKLKGKKVLVPVRVDGTEMPAVLMENVYIDMHLHGLEVAIRQIVELCTGTWTFTPQHEDFSNLRYKIIKSAIGLMEIEIKALYFAELNVSFMFALDNPTGDEELSADYNGFISHFKRILNGADGAQLQALGITLSGKTLSPNFPIRIMLRKSSPGGITLTHIMHEHAKYSFRVIPPEPGGVL